MVAVYIWYVNGNGETAWFLCLPAAQAFCAMVENDPEVQWLDIEVEAMQEGV